MKNVRQIVGSNIRLIREHKGWNQARLAKEIGISSTFMLHIERGTRGLSLDTIER
jgi:transcriptional regulator with XRE-family HTH domain